MRIKSVNGLRRVARLCPWYQHEELGYNYRMSNIIAGVARGNLLHIDEHIAQKKAIYERYREGLKDLPVTMNPYIEGTMEPNYWLSCQLIDEDAMCRQVWGEMDYLYKRIGEILSAGDLGCTGCV